LCLRRLSLRLNRVNNRRDRIGYCLNLVPCILLFIDLFNGIHYLGNYFSGSVNSFLDIRIFIKSLIDLILDHLSNILGYHWDSLCNTIWLLTFGRLLSMICFLVNFVGLLFGCRILCFIILNFLFDIKIITCIIINFIV
jgi:hypothetical protein